MDEKRAAKKRRRNNELQWDLGGADRRGRRRAEAALSAPMAIFSSSKMLFVQDEINPLFTTIVIDPHGFPAAGHER